MCRLGVGPLPPTRHCRCLPELSVDEEAVVVAGVLVLVGRRGGVHVRLGHRVANCARNQHLRLRIGEGERKKKTSGGEKISVVTWEAAAHQAGGPKPPWTPCAVEQPNGLAALTDSGVSSLRSSSSVATSSAHTDPPESWKSTFTCHRAHVADSRPPRHASQVTAIREILRGWRWWRGGGTGICCGCRLFYDHDGDRQGGKARTVLDTGSPLQSPASYDKATTWCWNRRRRRDEGAAHATCEGAARHVLN